MSARKKKKVEKMKEKAVGLNAVLENKVRQKEGRKVSVLASGYACLGTDYVRLWKMWQ